MVTQPPDDRSDLPPQLGAASRPLDQHTTHWGRRTGPLNRAAPPTDPPDLSRYADTPRYDMATILDLVEIRAVTLWAWEQNLGITTRNAQSNGPRYSERDMIAFLWLRDQIIAGVDPLAAAQKLREALAAAQGQPPPPPLEQFSVRPPSRPLSGLSARTGPDAGSPGQSLTRRGPTRPVDVTGPATGPRSQPVGATASGQTWVAQQRDLRMMVQPLLRALGQFDAIGAAQLLDEALMSGSVESVCSALLTPAITRINELWVRGDTIAPEGLFAVNTIKSRAFRLFDVVREHREPPLVCVACGPNEPHELDALVLALCLRRAGLRVAYLGQQVTGAILVDFARKQRPRAIALTLSSAARARLVAQMAREIARIDGARPRLCLTGAGLARNPDLRRRIDAIFLGVDPVEVTNAVVRLLRMEDATMAPQG